MSSNLFKPIQAHQEIDPPAQNYAPGVTVLLTIVPAIGYLNFIPLRWTIAGKPGPVATVPAIRFLWSDGSFTTRTNAAPPALSESIGQFFFNKNGLSCNRVEIIGTNPGALELGVNFGNFVFEGWQT